MSVSERVNTPISTAELERRWGLIRRDMTDRDIDALVMQSTNDWLGGYVKWFTDVPANNGYPRTVIFHRSDWMTVIEMGPFGSERDLDGRHPLHRGVGKIRHTPSFFSVNYTESYDSELALDELKTRGCRTVGLVNPGGMAHCFASRLEQGLSGRSSIVDVTDFVDRHKAIKSEEEVELIRRTASLQDDVFQRVLSAIKPGMRDIDLTSLAQFEGQKLGSEQGIFLGASARVGTISPFMPRHLQQRTFKSGDHLSILIEINGPGGFYTEIARTIVLGQASNQLLDGFESVREAQTHTLRQIRSGVSCRAVAEAHDDYMRARGLPPETRLYAHGQGYDMVERPLIRADESMCLEERMCLAVHPGYETPEMFAVICDNYMIGPEGLGECLHKTEKKVFEVPV
jgi:Xaa-Pro aminopeptidase